MARKFLYFIAACVVLVIGALLALRIWSSQLTEWAFVPGNRFVPQAPLATSAYDDARMWYAHPLAEREDPARWQPAYAKDSPPAAPGPATGTVPAFAVFFVHPTSYLDRSRWNAPLADGESGRVARLYVRGMASPFNQAAQVWAPRYRQATLGAFLTDKPEATRALDLAYHDVEQAFDAFLRSTDPAEPIVLAGHSQGSYHILRLVKDRVAGTPLARRIIAIYAIGWPISLQHDLPALGLPPCKSPGQSGCIASWGSFAEPADMADRLRRYARSIGLDGQPRGTGPILCTNPLTGGASLAAPASANLGTLKPDAELKGGELVAGGVPARCDKHGLLLIGDPPAMGVYVLPGNDYHVYDIPLFWRNLQADVNERARAWHPAP